MFAPYPQNKYHFIRLHKTIRQWLLLAMLACALLPANLHAQSPCPDPYTVQPGDYLTAIAIKCKVPYAELLKANPQITDPSKLKIGQQINIPGGTSDEVTNKVRLENATYFVDDLGEVTLVDGVATVRLNASTNFEFSIEAPIGEGDINQDGLPDAAVILTKRGDFRGRYYTLHLMLGQATGGFRNVATAAIDYDSIQVNSIQIFPKVIDIDMLTSKVESSAAGPTVQTIESYSYRNNQFTRMIDPTSKPVTLTERQICKGNSPLDVGKTAVVTPGLPNTLFHTAGGKAMRDEQNNKIEIPAGDKILIVDGPDCVGKVRYWKVNFGDDAGWTGEGDGKTTWLRLPTAASDQCPGYLTPQLVSGERAIVLPGAPNRLWDHLESSPAPQELDEMLPGTTMVVLDGPACQDGYVYWWVRSEKSGKEGWTAESKVGDKYYLEIR